MAKLCAPVRDDRIKQLTETTDVIETFKGILEVFKHFSLSTFQHIMYNFFNILDIGLDGFRYGKLYYCYGKT